VKEERVRRGLYRGEGGERERRGGRERK